MPSTIDMRSKLFKVYWRLPIKGHTVQYMLSSFRGCTHYHPKSLLKRGCYRKRPFSGHFVKELSKRGSSSSIRTRPKAGLLMPSVFLRTKFVTTEGLLSENLEKNISGGLQHAVGKMTHYDLQPRCVSVRTPLPASLASRTSGTPHSHQSLQPSYLRSPSPHLYRTRQRLQQA